ALSDVLDRAQAKRLRQLERQRLGTAVFNEVEILDALKLMPEQAAALESAYLKMLPMDGPFGKPAPKLLPTLVATLTAEQKKTWEGLLGEPFDLGKVEGLPPARSGPGGPVSPAGAYTTHGITLTGPGDYAGAIRAFDEAIRLGPKDPVGYNAKAYTLATCPE